MTKSDIATHIIGRMILLILMWPVTAGMHWLEINVFTVYLVLIIPFAITLIASWGLMIFLPCVELRDRFMNRYREGRDSGD